MELALIIFGVLAGIAVLGTSGKILMDLFVRRKRLSGLSEERLQRLREKKETFRKYRTKVTWNGILNAGLWGLAIGCGVIFLADLVVWFVGYDNFWLPIASGIGVAMILGSVLFFAKYRATDEEIARRVDRLGLEERIITMLELEENTSYVAARQRADAKARIAEATSGERRALKLKILLSNTAVIVLSVAFALSAASTTVVAVTARGVIPGGDEIIEEILPENYVTVSYTVEGDGEIVGETDQIIEEGADAEPVTAVATDGWMFSYWKEDGSESPDRWEQKVTENASYVAVFVQLEESEGDGSGDGSGDPGEGGEGDEATDQPDENAGDANEEGDGENGEDTEGNGDGDGGGTTDEEQDNNQAGGYWEEINKFLDGETYYQDKIDIYKEIAMEILASGGELPDGLREFIEKYYEGLS